MQVKWHFFSERMYSIPQTLVKGFRKEKTGQHPTKWLISCPSNFYLTRKKMLCNCLQASAAGAGDFKLTCMSYTLRRNIRMFLVFFLNSNICNLSSKRRLFLESYLWGYSFLSFLLVFFNEINLLYVYSLNKDNTVCNGGEPCVLIYFFSQSHACWAR